MRERDLMGYGGRPPAIVWPNGARVAVSLVVNFEEGAELAVGDGDAASERIGEVLSVVAPGRRDFGQEEIFAYGTRVGLWRFLDAFDRHERQATFYMCGRAVERLPALAAEIVAGDTNRLAMAGCGAPMPISPMRPRSGRRWCAASMSSATPPASARSASAAGAARAPIRGRCWANWASSTIPTASTTTCPIGLPPVMAAFLVVPYAFDTNDMKFFHPNGFVEPGQFVRYVEAALGTLVEEAGRGRSSLLNIGLHLRICGRPARFAAVEGILAALRSLGDRVWVARRDEIARHWLSATAHIGTD